MCAFRYVYVKRIVYAFIKIYIKYKCFPCPINGCHMCIVCVCLRLCAYRYYQDFIVGFILKKKKRVNVSGKWIKVYTRYLLRCVYNLIKY